MKNKMMRIASVLMVAVILSVCAVSGSFAKYVTSFEGTDTARVARWGVVMSVEGDGLSAFATEYESDDESYNPVASDPDSKVTVLSANTDKVVAPGTKGESAKVTLKGTPEVAVRLSFNIKDFQVPFLKAGTPIKDYTKLVLIEPAAQEGETAGAAEYGYADYEVPEDYYPILFTLKAYPFQQAPASDDSTPVETGRALRATADQEVEPYTVQFRTPEELEEALEEFTIDLSPNTTLDNVAFSLEWEWAFEYKEEAVIEPEVPQVRAGEAESDNGDEAEAEELTQAEIVDILDTYLGSEEELQKVSFTIALTATQID